MALQIGWRALQDEKEKHWQEGLVALKGEGTRAPMLASGGQLLWYMPNLPRLNSFAIVSTTSPLPVANCFTFPD